MCVGRDKGCVRSYITCMYLGLYLLIVFIGMGFVYVIVYFATYIQWRYMCTCTYSTYLIHVLPTSASAA